VPLLSALAGHPATARAPIGCQHRNWQGIIRMMAIAPASTNVSEWFVPPFRMDLPSDGSLDDVAKLPNQVAGPA
jgi:hypothetical protein